MASSDGHPLTVPGERLPGLLELCISVPVTGETQVEMVQLGSPAGCRGFGSQGWERLPPSCPGAS